MATASSSSTPAAAETLEITGMGHAGDGVTADGRYVPFTLPGERVTAASEVLRASPDRVVPPCPHFGACGGCALQHWASAPYLDWKRAQVVAALAARGLTGIPVAPVIALPPATRRRAVFAVKRLGTGVLLGFRARAEHRIVDQQACPVLVPAIDAARARLRGLAMAALAPGAMGVLTVLASDTGLDVALAIEGRRRDLGADARMGLAQAAATADLARLTVNGEVIAERRTPRLTVDGIAVAPPPGAFVQASAAAETALRAEMDAAIAGARRVADLFAGLGTFALPVAREAAVRAVEGDAALAGALRAAAYATPGLKPVTVEIRDLFRRPLIEAELKGLDAVVLDPPRAGARAQCEALARARVPRIAYVSCHPATFARDARCLVDGGYRLTRVAPVDQFLWSPHIEVVAAFARD